MRREVRRLAALICTTLLAAALTGGSGTADTAGASAPSLAVVPSDLPTHPPVLPGTTGLGAVVPDDIAQPLNATLSPSRPSVDIGEGLVFAANASGGSGDYVVGWASLPPGCNASGWRATCVFEALGTNRATVTVSDGTGTVVNASASVAVVAALGAALWVSPSSVDVGGGVEFGALASGGSAGYQYVYTGLWPGCATASSNELACSTTEPGPWSVSVRVSDANGFFTTSSPVLVQVFPPPSASLEVAPETPIAGANFSVRGAVTGGQAPYAVAWGLLPTDCSTALGASVICHPEYGENDSFGIGFTDEAGVTGSASLLVTVQGPPAPRPAPPPPPPPPPASPLPDLESGGAVAGFLVAVAVVVRGLWPRRRSGSGGGGGTGREVLSDGSGDQSHPGGPPSAGAKG